MTYCNERQEEFSALVQKLETIGWKPAGVARALGVSKATISNILKGKQTPRVPTLDSLRNIVKYEMSPEKVPSTAPTLGELNGQLAALKKDDPAGFLAASHTIRLLHSRLNSPRGEVVEDATNSSSRQTDKPSIAGQEAVRMLMEATEPHHRKSGPAQKEGGQ